MRRSDRRGPLVALAVVAAVGLAGCGDRDHHDERGSHDSALAAAVQVEAAGCQAAASIGAGSFIAEEHVVTVAHVVAGARHVHVVLADGRRVDATVVAIDRRKDLAVLHVEEDVAPLRRGSMRQGTAGTFTVYRDDRPVSLPFEATAAVTIDAPDIDGTGSSLRSGYRLSADVEQGDSGSVLVARGRAAGVVFARSTATGNTAWAIDISEVDALLAAAGDDAVDLGACV